MSNRSVYQDYVSDQDFMKAYLEYQARYASDIRESDKILIERVRAVRQASGERDLLVLDLGCSTGNLLRHIAGSVRGLRLVGGELSQDSLEQCRADPGLAGMDFEEMDVVDLRDEARFDIIIVNAVLYMMNDEEFRRSLEGTFAALATGGQLMVFDFFHPFPQHLAIRETSHSHKEGLMLHFRPMADVEQQMTAVGFQEIEFAPFEIPIDLTPAQDDRDAFLNLHSYTVPAQDGRRLLFRGTLFQPWCHLFARKPG